MIQKISNHRLFVQKWCPATYIVACTGDDGKEIAFSYMYGLICKQRFIHAQSVPWHTDTPQYSLYCGTLIQLHFSVSNFMKIYLHFPVSNFMKIYLNFPVSNFMKICSLFLFSSIGFYENFFTVSWSYSGMLSRIQTCHMDCARFCIFWLELRQKWLDVMSFTQNIQRFCKSLLSSFGVTTAVQIVDVYDENMTSRRSGFVSVYRT
jgi:hypothetical protein